MPHGGPAKELNEIDGLMEKAEDILDKEQDTENILAGVGYAVLTVAKLLKMRVESEGGT